MNKIKIIYSLSVQNYLKKLHPEIKAPLKDCIEELFENPLKGKPLKDDLEGFRSHRYKRYRIIYYFDIKLNRIEILYAGKRTEVYQQFSEYIKNLTQD